MRRRRDPLIFWCVGFTALTLLPTANLLFPIGTVMAERFLYLPCLGFVAALVSLASRLERPRETRIAFALVLALWMGRTLLRNPAWNSDLDLALADVQTAPHSFGLHQRLADALYEQEPQANLDRAIRESEIAWRILEDLPSEWRFQQTAANLGAYYRSKGDALGGPGVTQGRLWYEKALAILKLGRESARAVEKNHDEAQRAHGKPLARRVAFRNIYFNLGAVSALLGQNSEALESYRYGRLLDPGSTDPYEEISGVYQAAGNSEWAAIALHEKGQLEGYLPPTMAALSRLYGATDA
jgi:tetratricopeptide (TPR) repeat protein